ncbi:MAG TPA: hypothetical protein VNW06_01785 [Cytophagaceae bacterium]|jgi:hypothetical protein|nr:hypothetical protein [Cytophagaceae bacterium]
MLTIQNVKELMSNKSGYFQGGGGENEPTPGKPKYKKEPLKKDDTKARGLLFRNYDLYNTKGVDGPGKVKTPGTGLYQHMNEYKSVSDFRKKKRKKAMLYRQMALLTAVAEPESVKEKKYKDSNNIDANEDVTPIPISPAEVSPIGMLDGIYPKEDLDGKSVENLYYGRLETHLSDDGVDKK